MGVPNERTECVRLTTAEAASRAAAAVVDPGWPLADEGELRRAALDVALVLRHGERGAILGSARRHGYEVFEQRLAAGDETVVALEAALEAYEGRRSAA